MPAARKASSRDPETEYVRSQLSFLATAADREAVRLIFHHGVFAVSDPTGLDDAIARLWDNQEHDAKERALLEELDAAQVAHDTERERLAFIRLNDLQGQKTLDMNETAYLLGIAVGRRLGAAAFGGVR